MNNFDFLSFYQRYEAVSRVANDAVLQAEGITLGCPWSEAKAKLAGIFLKELQAITAGQEISEFNRKWLYESLNKFPELFESIDFHEIMKFLVSYAGSHRPDADLFGFIQRPKVMEKLHNSAYSKRFAALMILYLANDRSTGPYMVKSWLVPNFGDLPEVLDAIGRRIIFLEKIGMLPHQEDKEAKELWDLRYFVREGSGLFNEEETKLYIERPCTYPHKTVYVMD